MTSPPIKNNDLRKENEKIMILNNSFLLLAIMYMSMATVFTIMNYFKKKTKPKNVEQEIS